MTSRVYHQNWHYHATLSCGCHIRFNMAENVFLTQIENDPEADGVLLHIRCDNHDLMAETRNLAVTTADTGCAACKAANTSPRKGRVSPWNP